MLFYFVWLCAPRWRRATPNVCSRDHLHTQKKTKPNRSFGQYLSSEGNARREAQADDLEAKAAALVAAYKDTTVGNERVAELTVRGRGGLQLFRAVLV